MDPHPDLLLHLLVGLEPGCNKSLRGRSNEPTRENASSNESSLSAIEVLPEEIPDELGHEWRVLHPFELQGMRFPMDSTPLNQRRLAENDAVVELIQTTEYLEDTPTCGNKETIDFTPLDMVTPSTEEEAEEEVDVEEDKNGSMKDQQKE